MTIKQGWGTAQANFAFFVKFVVVLGRTFDYSLRRRILIGQAGLADGPETRKKLVAGEGMMKILSEKIMPPVVSVVGNSGVGKTTFLEKVIREMTHRGLRVGTIKHDVHGRFEMDKPGKDSWRHKHAGASTTVISSPYRIGMVMDVEYDHSIDELVPFFNGMDIVFTEGYKQDQKPKLEIFRPEIIQKPLCKNDETLIALVSDAPIDFGVPVFPTEDIKGVADFLIVRFDLEYGSQENRNINRD